MVGAYLYGSHAAGRAVPDSDVDVAILLEVDTSPGEAFDVLRPFLERHEKTLLRSLAR